MIRAEEIRQKALAQSVKPEIIEKDYVLSWVIAALNAHDISTSWIFKGGTALKKCYFHEYRFSEDLDYSLSMEDDISEKVLRLVCSDIANWLYDKSGIEILQERSRFEIFENLDNRNVAQIRLYYRGPISPSSPRQAPRIKLDLTTGECLTDVPVISKVYHPYTDLSSFEPKTLCYSFNELFAEKLRAFVERCRPRDIYDIVYCFADKHADLKEVGKQFKQKCGAKNVEYSDESVALSQLAAARSYWDEQLAHQIANLESFDVFSEKVARYYSEFIKNIE
jgi:predicted nucleotidyltransferase component of viral defense system